MTQPSDNGVPPGAQPAGSHDSLTQRGSAEAVSVAIFAQRRAELGLTHEDVANQLKFAPRFIEALEAGEFEKLPGRTFARGMLRSYAKMLKIDPAPFLAQVGPGGMPQPATEQAVSLRAPVPFAEGGRHGNLVYAALSIVVLATAAFFAFEWYLDRDAPSKLGFVSPGQETAPTPAAVPPAAAPALPTVAAPQSDPKAATFASAGPAPVPETTQRTEGANVEPKPPLAPGKGRIVLRFEKESWVEIKGRNGTLLSQLNPAGSEKTVEGDPPFQLTIGNAPSVQVTYNDQPVDLKPHFKVDVARLTLK
jgi:cytoskeleton protein RodZ